jgi:hypothetical protein
VTATPFAIVAPGRESRTATQVGTVTMVVGVVTVEIVTVEAIVEVVGTLVVVEMVVTYAVTVRVVVLVVITRVQGADTRCVEVDVLGFGCMVKVL